MKEFTDDLGGAWVASAREEETPRHHGRWYLVFHTAGDESRLLVMPEVRWQSRRSADRTLNPMFFGTSSRAPLKKATTSPQSAVKRM